jgi:hypothetical protein
MRHEFTGSSNVKSAELTGDTCTVTFKDGTKAHYKGFTPEKFEDFVTAPSAGRWFHANVRLHPELYPLVSGIVPIVADPVVIEGVLEASDMPPGIQIAGLASETLPPVVIADRLSRRDEAALPGLDEIVTHKTITFTTAAPQPAAPPAKVDRGRALLDKARKSRGA